LIGKGEVSKDRFSILTRDKKERERRLQEGKIRKLEPHGGAY